jgi:hypothetical protein
MKLAIRFQRDVGAQTATELTVAQRGRLRTRAQLRAVRGDAVAVVRAVVRLQPALPRPCSSRRGCRSRERTRRGRRCPFQGFVAEGKAGRLPRPCGGLRNVPTQACARTIRVSRLLATRVVLRTLNRPSPVGEAARSTFSDCGLASLGDRYGRSSGGRLLGRQSLSARRAGRTGGAADLVEGRVGNCQRSRVAGSGTVETIAVRS